MTGVLHRRAVGLQAEAVARESRLAMGRVTVGYQDACVYPLWLSRLNLRLARLMGASAFWLPDHFMSFTPASAWTLR